MKFSARGSGLAEGHQPIEKYFIVLAFQMAGGGRLVCLGEEEALTDSR